VSVDSVDGGPNPAWQTHAGFTEIYHQNVAAVYRYCLRRCGTPHDAEELTALVFVECWRGRAKLDLYDGAPAAWLLGIATNLLRNSWRARRRREAALMRLRHEGAAFDATDDVVGRVAGVTHEPRITSAVNGLPAQQRDVVSLCILGGLTSSEAAVALGVPVGTVKSRLSRGTATLRSLLGDLDPSLETRHE
jgi:RNA polymerase sigma factor (sigma-70 family)